MDKSNLPDGWDAIENEFMRVYQGQDDHRHLPLTGLMGEREGILQGISIFEADGFWHFVTYGMTELFDKECENEDVSGLGTELTFKLKRQSSSQPDTAENNEMHGICNILQHLANVSVSNSVDFSEQEFIYTGQKQGIDFEQKSQLTGFIVMKDTTVNSITSVNGRSNFTLLIGATESELLALKKEETTKDELLAKIGGEVTDYARKSVI
ncbi:MAG: suppressor of fused domain protein [Eubacteriales bacterium]